MLAWAASGSRAAAADGGVKEVTSSAPNMGLDTVREYCEVRDETVVAWWSRGDARVLLCYAARVWRSLRLWGRNKRWSGCVGGK